MALTSEAMWALWYEHQINARRLQALDAITTIWRSIFIIKYIGIPNLRTKLPRVVPTHNKLEKRIDFKNRHFWLVHIGRLFICHRIRSCPCLTMGPLSLTLIICSNLSISYFKISTMCSRWWTLSIVECSRSWAETRAKASLGLDLPPVLQL